MKIVIISNTPYKEKDAIVNAISEEGAITFLVRGMLSPKSKNAGLNTNLAIADIELSEGNFKYPLLKSSTIIESPMMVKNEFYYLSSLMVINEAIKELLQDEEKGSIYPSLIEALSVLKQTENPLLVDLIFLGRIFKYSGYEFEVNKCVFCGSKKNIKTFSFPDGGFVCENCVDPNTERDLSNDQMLLLRNIINAPRLDSTSAYASQENCLVIFNKFVEFISDSYGVHLKNAILMTK